MTDICQRVFLLPLIMLSLHHNQLCVQVLSSVHMWEFTCGHPQQTDKSNLGQIVGVRHMANS